MFPLTRSTQLRIPPTALCEITFQARTKFKDILAFRIMMHYLSIAKLHELFFTICLLY